MVCGSRCQSFRSSEGKETQGNTKFMKGNQLGLKGGAEGG